MSLKMINLAMENELYSKKLYGLSQIKDNPMAVKKKTPLSEKLKNIFRRRFKNAS